MSQEEHESIKQEILDHLSKKTYKLSIATIITIVGGTVSVCLSMFGVALHVDRSINSEITQTIQNTKDILESKKTERDLWLEANTLQNEINQHIESDAETNRIRTR